MQRRVARAAGPAAPAPPAPPHEPPPPPRWLSDFTGYWRLLRTEGFDEFCRELGFPWVVRKAALRFMGGGSSVDVIAQSGTARDTTLTITSLNPKGSWMRTYDTARDVVQQNAEGTRCKTTAWWEGRVFHSKMEPPPGASFGTIESLRYLHRDFQVVKTGAVLAGAGRAGTGRQAGQGWRRLAAVLCGSSCGARCTQLHTSSPMLLLLLLQW